MDNVVEMYHGGFSLASMEIRWPVGAGSCLTLQIGSSRDEFSQLRAGFMMSVPMAISIWSCFICVSARLMH